MRGEEEKETGPAEKKMALLKKKNGSAEKKMAENERTASEISDM